MLLIVDVSTIWGEAQFSIAGGCDSVGVTGEGGDELGYLSVSSDPREFLLGFEQPCCCPPSSHVAVVAPPFHVPGCGPHDRDHRLDHVGAHQRAVDSETANGEHVIESFTQRSRSVGIGPLQFGGETFRFEKPSVGVRVTKR